MDGEDAYPRVGYGPEDLKPDHEWIATALRFKKPDGTWGELVDLKGDRGDIGPQGPSPFGLSGNDAYYTAGKVGMGTISPTEKLHVIGKVKG